MRFALSTVLATAALAAASIPAAAQQNTFTLLSSKTGKPIGRASYSIDKTKAGFKVKSKFEYKLGGAATQVESADPDKPNMSNNLTEAQYSAEYTIDATGNSLGGYTQNGSTQTLTSMTPSKARDTVILGMMQGGVAGPSQTLPMPKPDYTIATDFDPSGMQVLLLAARTHPHPDHLYLLLNPGTGPKSGPMPLYLTIADPTDATGSLDGKPVALKAYALRWNKSKGILYADTDGTLMQAEVGTINAIYTRTKFQLDAASATAAPAAK